MRPCPNCSQPIADGIAICPNCGADMPAVWPPPPEGNASPDMSAAEKIIWVRRQVNKGFDYGSGTGFALWLFSILALLYTSARNFPVLFVPATYALPLITLLVWYFRVRRLRPYFARGLGYSILITVAFLLGMLVICR
jgi:hypothetical protein